MTLREFYRYYLLKTLLGIIVLQFAVFYWLEKRNHRPVAIDDHISVFEGQSVGFKPMINDEDKDEDDLSLQDVGQPAHGSVEKLEDKILYTAAMGFSGTDSFAYTVNDGKKTSKKAYVKVNIDKNQGPLALDDHIMLYSGNTSAIAVLGNDVDREGDSVYIDSFTQPLMGTLIKQGNLLVYTSSKNNAAVDSFHYVASDGYSLSDTCTVHITVKSKTDPLYPWLYGDMGKPSIPGNVSGKKSNLMVKASGSDIWGNSDNGYFVYRPVSGDCEMSVRVTSLDDTHPWAKAGIMVRESTGGPSRNVFHCLSSANGVSFQRRTETGSDCQSDKHQGEGIKAPYWLKIVRKGNVFTAYGSPDGKVWNEVGNAVVELPLEVLMGLAVTSHDDSKICMAQFDEISLK
jgi:regulation of enolase protein 1 (concanavalin A-like superfamily)